MDLSENPGSLKIQLKNFGIFKRGRGKCLKTAILLTIYFSYRSVAL